MEKLEFGETAVLENGKEYVCFANLEENGVDYVYLVSNFKPLEVRFAKQVMNGEELLLEIVQDQALKEHLLELFKAKMGK
ncbi:MAG: hypothetical protein ACI4XM_04170 [Candidatus Coprovivens sp.]